MSRAAICSCNFLLCSSSRRPDFSLWLYTFCQNGFLAAQFFEGGLFFFDVVLDTVIGFAKLVKFHLQGAAFRFLRTGRPLPVPALYFPARCLASLVLPDAFDVFDLMHELGELAGAQLFSQQVELACLLGGKAQGFDLAFDFGFDVVDTGQVGCCIVQPAQASFLRILNLAMPAASSNKARRSSGRLFKISSILFCPDNGHRAASQTGICQKVEDVF